MSVNALLHSPATLARHLGDRCRWPRRIAPHVGASLRRSNDNDANDFGKYMIDCETKRLARNSLGTEL